MLWGLISRMYRVIPAAEFLATFSSDRRHMLGEDGEYISPPPLWPIIQNGGDFLDLHELIIDCENNLQEFIEMNDSNGYGRVLQEHEFLDFCYCKMENPVL